jgi:hypothetical protein
MMSHRAIYWTAGGVLAVMLVIAMLTWNYNKANAEALDKADQLISSYQSAGLTPPRSAQNVAEVLGTDGGEVCVAASSDYLLGVIKTRLGVGGEFGFRPTIVDGRPLQGAALIVQTYCPEEAPRLQEFIDGLKSADLTATS